MLKALLYFLFFFIPIQLGRHFWFDWSYKLGVRVDYLSPTVFFTDILVLLIIAVFMVKNQKLPTRNRYAQSVAGGKVKSLIKSLKLRKISFLSRFIVILLILAVNWWVFVVGENPWLFAYSFLRLGLLGLLGYIIAKTFTKKDFPQIIKVLNWALILQVSLAAYQVVVERSADLWILGERSFSIITPGIARFLAPGGQLLLRGYGTFPHPNVLGGFCLLMLSANVFLFLSKFTTKVKEKSVPGGWYGIYMAGFVFSLLGIWLSMSVLAIVLSQVFLLGIGAWIFGRAGKQRADIWVGLYGLMLVIPIIILVAGIWYLAAGNTDSISRRIVLLQYSWEMFKTSPVFGVGLGNYIPAMPEKPVGSTYFWQPVHNIPALILVETGLVGMVIAGWLFLKLFQNIKNQISNIKNTLRLRSEQARQKLNYQLLIIIGWWGVILITGLFDHYWLTLQQGRLMLVMVVGLTFVGASNSQKVEK